ncbi:hypothetical protein NPIL_426081, partial [Nephila pilipes]
MIKTRVDSETEFATNSLYYSILQFNKALASFEEKHSIIEYLSNLGRVSFKILRVI